MVFQLNKPLILVKSFWLNSISVLIVLECKTAFYNKYIQV